MPLKLRNLFCAITILGGVLATEPCAQPLEEDDDSIWIEFEMKIRPQPGDPTGNTYRGGKVSLRVSGLLEPMDYDTPEAMDNPDLIGFFGSEIPWTMSAEPCVEVGPDGSASTLPICRINHQATVDVTVKCDLSTGLCEFRILSWEIATWPEGAAVDFDHAFGCLYEAQRQETSCEPRVLITRDDLEGDFEKSYTWEDIGGGLFVTGCPSIPSYRLVLRARPPDETKLTLAGCADIMMGVAAEITATARPEGGTYTWRVEPADVLSISGSGSTATVTGKSAGRATIKAEYQPERGKKVEATLPGSVVELLSVNGGADIPPIGLYDETGAARPPVQIPTVQDPPDGSLLSFPVADAGVATVGNLGSGIVVQGVHEGVTTTQGKTPCGNQDEHLITITVVPCDKETIQKLRDRLKELKAQCDEIRAETDRLLKSPEFSRAKHEFDENLTKCVVKVLSILASGLGAAEGAASGAVPKATDLDNIAEMLGDFYDATEDGTWKGNWSLWNMYKEYQINVAKKMALGIADDVIEYGEAWFAVEDALQVMKEFVKTLKENRMKYKEVRSQHDEIDRRLVEVCKDFDGGDGEPGGSEPTQPQQASPEPKGSAPPQRPGGSTPPTRQGGSQPPTDQPSGGGEQPQSPADGDNGATDDDIYWDPPFPPGSPPASGGFPIDCDCDQWGESSGAGQTGLGPVGRGIDILSFCMKRFEQETLNPLKVVNDSALQLLVEIESGLELPEDRRADVFRGLLPRMSHLKERFTGLGNELVTFKEASSDCESAPQGMAEAIERNGALPSDSQ